ncbi:MAG: PASTA domain-containing protein [Capsulimonadales bacterium]|nr:PASTA domain-containing protein [Capsulimonadales bacterium]
MVNDPYENSVSRTGLVNRLLAGRYEVLETLGEGPLLTAYRARDRQVNRIVTVKAIRPQFAKDDAVLRRLREGIGAAYSLAHSNIARVFDIGTDEETGLLYLAEEYVRGIDLKERIRRNAPFQLAPATDTAIAIAEALEAAHARGVTHGDVRPQNVLIGPEGQIKLTNFGIATAQSEIAASDPALLKRIVGYVAPDAAGTVAMPSSDLYSLGCLLFEMLTGDLPYPDENPIRVALKHAQESVPSARLINGAVPPALDGILQKAMAKTPAQRYASASELLIDLRAVRDALRFGKPLNWTPRERENSARTPVLPPERDGSNEVTALLNPLPVRPVTAPPPVAATHNVPARGVAADPIRPERMATAAVPPPNVAPYAVEEEKNVRPVRAKGVQWLTLINLFMAILLVGALGGLYWVIMSSNRPDAVVVLPSLIGKTVTEAREMAAEKNFELAIVGREFRDNDPKDVIYQQSIRAGSSIKPGRPVPVWVSDGPRMVIVPDVSDAAIERARKILERAGLSIGSLNYEYDPIVAKGNVLRQAPPPGENKPRGTKVDLILSKGAEPVETPEPIPTPDPFAEPTPDAEVSSETPVTEPTVRYLKVIYPPTPIDEGDEPHRIRIDILDEEGPRTIKDELVQPGQQIRLDHVKVVGSPITIKVYDNDELKVDLTR